MVQWPPNTCWAVSCHRLQRGLLSAVRDGVRMRGRSVNGGEDGGRSFMIDTYHLFSSSASIYIHDRSFRECTRGGFCNFMHLKPISRELQWVAFTAPVLCTNAPCVSISLLPSSFSVATSILVRPTTGSSLVVAADHEVHAGTHTSCTYLWACQNSMSISTLHFCPLSGPGLVVAPAHLAEGVRTRSEVNSNTHTVYSNTWRTV